VKPHFFGDKSAPLYGVYDEPRATTAVSLAVIACYPVAGEYMRAHRAFRQLTTLLSRAGAHVMRFDYSGTGDSSGTMAEASVSRWKSDIRAAVSELRALCGAAKVKVVGLRLGATLGLLAAQDEQLIEHVVMWDPIVDGASYVRQLEGSHLAEQTGRNAAGRVDGTIGVHGFGVTRNLREEMAAIDLRRWTPRAGLRVDAVVSSEEPSWLAFRDHLATLRTPTGFEISPSAGNWHEADEFGSALIPQQIIQSVVARIVEKRA